MRYEFVSMGEAGNGFDYIVRLRQFPDNWWDRLLRRRAKELAFYGHDGQWHTIDMTRLKPQINEVLRHMWHEHAPSWTRDASGRLYRIRQSNSGQAATSATQFDTVDETLDESFPASDPPSWTTTAISL